MAQSVSGQLPLCRTESLLVLLAALFRAFNVSFFLGSQLLLKFSVFSAFARGGGELTPRAVFTFLSLLELVVLHDCLLLARGLLVGADVFVALRRIQVCRPWLGRGKGRGYRVREGGDRTRRLHIGSVFPPS